MDFVIGTVKHRHMQHSQDSTHTVRVAVLIWILRKLPYSQYRYPGMYTTVTVYLLYSDLVIVHIKPLTTLAVSTQPELQLIHGQQVPHSQGNYHAVSGIITQDSPCKLHVTKLY